MHVTATSLSSITLNGHLNDMDLYGIYVVPLFATAFTTTFTMPTLLGDVVLLFEWNEPIVV